MRIVEATYESVFSVAQAMRDSDYAEFSAVSFADNRDDMAAVLAARYGRSPEIHVGFGDDGEPICVGGTVQSRPNVITLLFFATDRFPEIGLPITRYIKKQLFPRLRAAGVHRIEAVSSVDHTDAHAWLEALGMQAETAPMLNYGKNGEAFLQFSWVRADG